MGTIVRQSGKYKAVVRRKGHRHIYEIFNKLSDARSFMIRRYRVIFQGNRCMLSYPASGFLFLTVTKFPKNIFQTWNPNTI